MNEDHYEYQATVRMVQQLLSGDENNRIELSVTGNSAILRMRLIGTPAGTQFAVKEVTRGSEGSGAYFALNDIDGALDYFNQLASKKVDFYKKVFERLSKGDPTFHCDYVNS